MEKTEDTRRSSQAFRVREICLDLVEEWAARIGLDEWSSATHRLVGGAQAVLPASVLVEWEKCYTWLVGRVWPADFPELADAMANFHHVLRDFLLTFGLHREQMGEFFETQRFYRITEWNEELYDKLLTEYKRHVDLIADLVLELARAANLVCDRVREVFDPTFQLANGAVVVWECQPEYTEEERAERNPYPGLAGFERARFERSVFYGEPNEKEED